MNVQDHSDSSRSISFLGHIDELFKLLVLDRPFDITLVAGVDATRISAHRDVLSSGSEYFRTMFNGTFAESHKNDVILLNVTEETLKSIINFCYNGKIDLNLNNVRDLIESSTEYLFPKIVNVCVEYMISLLCPENCIGFMEFAERYDLFELHIKARQMLSRNFTASAKSDEFKKIPTEKLKDILAMDELHVQSEMEIVNAIKIWIDHDDVRNSYACELFKLVRLFLLDQKDISSLIEEFSGSKFGTLLRNILTWQSKRNPKMPDHQANAVVVCQAYASSIAEYYCLESSKWKYWKPLKMPTLGLSQSVAWNNGIYYFVPGKLSKICRWDITSGDTKDILNYSSNSKISSVFAVAEGCYGGVYFCENNSVYWYDGEKWRLLKFECSSNETKFVVNGNYMYCYMREGRVPIIDKYQLSSTDPKWVHRSRFDSCTFDEEHDNIVALKDYIFIVGYVVARYDTRDDTWTKLSDVPSSLERLIVCNDTIYGQYLGDVYLYNEKEDIWTKMPIWNGRCGAPYLFTVSLGGHPKSA